MRICAALWWLSTLISSILTSPGSSSNYILDEMEDYTLVKSWPSIKKPFHKISVQSPTNINTENARSCFHLPPIVFHRTSHLPEEPVIIENTGYYLEILLDENVEVKPYVTGGPLFAHHYFFEQMHFHWGAEDHRGSEHLVDGKAYSTEVHMVYYNEKYGSFDAAKNYTDGVAVISFFGELSETDNPDLADLCDKLAMVKQPHSKVTGSFKVEFEFVNILFQQTDYYAFPGSLTTPDYNECVTWIMYTNPFPISHKQLESFRSLIKKDGQGMIRENDRELQPFGGRPIVTPLFNTEFEVESDESKSS